MGYKFTDDAREALAGILYYIAEDNKVAAMRVNDQVINTCETLAEMPGMGWHPEFATDKGLLCFPVKKYNHYLLFYRKRRGGGIAIVDIMHGARDLPALFGDK